MGRTVWPLLLCGLVLCASCKKDDEDDAEGDAPAEKKEELFRVKGNETPFSFRLPPSWEVDKALDIAPVKDPPAQKEGALPEIELSGRLIFAAQAEKSDGVMAPPRLQIFHDPWLPVGTTATDYLKKQRKQNEEAIRKGQEDAVSEIRHVEAERSRREGRPAYYVRDEWDFSAAGQKVTVTQETLLLIEKVEDALHGYALVITLLGDDKKKMGDTVREILDSVSFKGM